MQVPAYEMRRCSYARREVGAVLIAAGGTTCRAGREKPHPSSPLTRNSGTCCAVAMAICSQQARAQQLSNRSMDEMITDGVKFAPGFEPKFISLVVGCLPAAVEL